ncbi:tRNA guanosine(34) transglycosylase Tgt [Xanthobacter dioxanivorans]|uniref:Queuine tRNA-ribosyltransferase n=1 Tax=Xanthobacter dioxanivorans TaxID=2528964 RepID=A0A974SII6_9HYPH|nr:tRNA guanosine(34) transglycosylase Tgt [Xanthobacter dioxanivorans]QRG05408.1 tRNA guanosine(34) transglycosylase Tgt [Xanthobacter dioxanivorans]
MTRPLSADSFSFTLSATCGAARTGLVSTPRGAVRTPAFMPVGTAATVKGLYFDQVKAAGADIVLANTYHLMLRPGAERIARLGGLHAFMRWDGPILTDSGGFQVMSLSGLRKMSEQGVTFRSHVDGAYFEMSPERSVEIQGLLGADIQMQLDECVRLPCADEEAERAMRLSLRWAERSRRAFETQPKGRALFGIVQGGAVPTLRVESARALADMDFPGYSIGGLAVGEPQEVMLAMIETVEPHLPAGKPRYLMGVGTPDDLLESVARGIDMFDCVMPTRSGRHAQAFTRFGRLNLKNARHAEDPRPLDETSDCPALRDYSRAYLHHLVRCEEMLGSMLLTWANVHYYQQLMAGARAAIAAGRYGDYVAEVKEGWARGDLPVWAG